MIPIIENAYVHWVFIKDVGQFAVRSPQCWDEVRHWCTSGWPVHIFTANEWHSVALLDEFRRRGHLRLWVIDAAAVRNNPVVLRRNVRDCDATVLTPMPTGFVAIDEPKLAARMFDAIQCLTET